MDELFDVELLRKDLINYYGSASMYNPNAMADLLEIERLNDNELVEFAIDHDIDLSKYMYFYDDEINKKK